MNELQPIADYTKYNERMSLSSVDKLFFADKITPDLVVDFGCSDGSLLRQLKSLKPELNVIGYDNDETMIEHSTEDIPISYDWCKVMDGIKKHKSSAIILSSVIHEIFHYSSRKDTDYFWKQVFEPSFEYFDGHFQFIVIRDMVPSRSIDRPSNINDLTKIYRKFLGTKLLNDFESVWGSVENNKNLIHFLLKYKYSEPNWEREVRENYFPINRESLLSKIPENYEIIFYEHYVLPYLYQMIKTETGIEIKDPTHMKLILKRN